MYTYAEDMLQEHHIESKTRTILKVILDAQVQTETDRLITVYDIGAGSGALVSGLIKADDDGWLIRRIKVFAVEASPGMAQFLRHRQSTGQLDSKHITTEIVEVNALHFDRVRQLMKVGCDFLVLNSVVHEIISYGAPEHGSARYDCRNFVRFMEIWSETVRKGGFLFFRDFTKPTPTCPEPHLHILFESRNELGKTSTTFKRTSTTLKCNSATLKRTSPTFKRACVTKKRTTANLKRSSATLKRTSTTLRRTPATVSDVERRSRLLFKRLVAQYPRHGFHLKFSRQGIVGKISAAMEFLVSARWAKIDIDMPPECDRPEFEGSVEEQFFHFNPRELQDIMEKFGFIFTARFANYTSPGYTEEWDKDFSFQLITVNSPSNVFAAHELPPIKWSGLFRKQ